jgi:dTMP kinase
MFITIEGCDGVGKSTLLRNLVERLSRRGVDVVATREPGGSSLGTEIRKILLSASQPIDPMAETLLFLADRRQHLVEVIEPALSSGKVMICDRFHDSTIAYQGYGRGLGGESIERLCQETCGGRWPDLTFWIDLDPSVALQRARRESGRSDRFEDQEVQFHERIDAGFRALAARCPDRIIPLDGTLSQEKLASAAEECIVRSPHWK